MQVYMVQDGQTTQAINTMTKHRHIIVNKMPIIFNDLKWLALMSALLSGVLRTMVELEGLFLKGFLI